MNHWVTAPTRHAQHFIAKLTMLAYFSVNTGINIGKFMRAILGTGKHDLAFASTAPIAVDMRAGRSSPEEVPHRLPPGRRENVPSVLCDPEPIDGVYDHGAH